MSISEDQRRNGVKNADLISDLPTEKALSIQWNIPDDSFFFSTYRWMEDYFWKEINSIYDPERLASPFVLEGR